MEDQTPETYQTKRITVLTAEEILGKTFRVLDDGFVRLVDYMGADQSIVQAARVSYGIGTRKVQEDSLLIKYLMRHRHTTPFEMVEFKFHVRVPMDCWRQWIRHRTASVNEYSTRYSIAIDSAQKTPSTEWRIQSGANRQGSSGYLEKAKGEDLSEKEKQLHELSKELYKERIEGGVAREQARKDLPLSTYTEAYWKIDLHNLFHFLSLRMEAHAQHEIRSYANIIGEEIASKVVPIAYEAFKEYRLNGISLSQLDQIAINRIIKGEDLNEVVKKIFPLALGTKISRERNEFLAKWKKLSE